jgi:hypothetical protein
MPIKTPDKPLRIDAELWQLVNEGAKRTRLTTAEFTRQAIRKGAPVVIQALAAMDLSPLTSEEWEQVNTTMAEDLEEMNRIATRSALPDPHWLDR